MPDQLNQPAKELYLTFAGEIDEMVMRRILAHFSEAFRDGVRIAHLLIQSPGGIMDVGIAMHNVLSRGPVSVFTYNAGCVDSAAVPVFLAGKQRYAAHNATFSIHKTAVPYGLSTAAIAQSKSIKTQRLDEANEAIIRSYADIPPEKWAVQATGNLNISAEEAKQFGLITDIKHFAPPPDARLENVTF